VSPAAAAADVYGAFTNEFSHKAAAAAIVAAIFHRIVRPPDPSPPLTE